VLIAHVHQGEEHPKPFAYEDLAESSDVAESTVAREPIERYVISVAAKLCHLLSALLSRLRLRGIVVIDIKRLRARELRVFRVSLIRNWVVESDQVVPELWPGKSFDRVSQKLVEFKLHH
jgi:hypothetical protein